MLVKMQKVIDISVKNTCRGTEINRKVKKMELEVYVRDESSGTVMDICRLKTIKSSV